MDQEANAKSFEFLYIVTKNNHLLLTEHLTATSWTYTKPTYQTKITATFPISAIMTSPFSNKPHAFNPDTVATPPPTYNQVAITPILPTSKFITLAGQTGIIPSTGKTPSNFVEQVTQAYINVHNCLKAVGATPRDIIHVRHYIVQDSRDEELNKLEVVERGWGELWIEFMDKEGRGHRPPDTVLGVASLALEGLKYEVEVWAIIHS